MTLQSQFYRTKTVKYCIPSYHNGTEESTEKKSAARSLRLLEEAHNKALDPKHTGGGVYTTRNWFMIWLIPSLGVFGALLAFLFLFHNDKKVKVA